MKSLRYLALRSLVQSRLTEKEPRFSKNTDRYGPDAAVILQIMNNEIGEITNKIQCMLTKLSIPISNLRFSNSYVIGRFCNIIFRYGNADFILAVTGTYMQNPRPSLSSVLLKVSPHLAIMLGHSEHTKKDRYYHKKIRSLLLDLVMI